LAAAPPLRSALTGVLCFNASSDVAGAFGEVTALSTLTRCSFVSPQPAKPMNKGKNAKDRKIRSLNFIDPRLSRNEHRNLWVT
jgi:hypothetical protein